MGLNTWLNTVINVLSTLDKLELVPDEMREKLCEGELAAAWKRLNGKYYEEKSMWVVDRMLVVNRRVFR